MTQSNNDHVSTLRKILFVFRCSFVHCWKISLVGIGRALVEAESTWRGFVLLQGGVASSMTLLQQKVSRVTHFCVYIWWQVV